MSKINVFKISVIMQVYLGDYPGAREYAREKYVRAINSFLAQSYPHKELVIISDGCVFAKRIYELVYSEQPSIKFVQLDRKGSKKMYESVNDKPFYRGYPKAVGCQHATGDIICYLDADDIMLPDHLFALHTSWALADPQTKWGSNNLRIVHTDFLKMNLPHEIRDVFSYRTVDLSMYGIYEDFVVNICTRPGEFSCATANLSHRKDIDLTWTDTESKHEDVVFVQKLVQMYPKPLQISSPTMVVCHYKNGWDV